jgi:hypothetical protein
MLAHALHSISGNIAQKTKYSREKSWTSNCKSKKKLQFIGGLLFAAALFSRLIDFVLQ